MNDESGHHKHVKSNDERGNRSVNREGYIPNRDHLPAKSWPRNVSDTLPPPPPKPSGVKPPSA